MPIQISNETRRQLIAAAQGARQHAYSPYSHYPVGAALLSIEGELFTGCNVENASYGGTICAERTALVKAVSEGAHQFAAIAVVTGNGGAPCGLCRQVLYEFGPEMLVIIADTAGQIVHEYSLHELLPYGFGPQQLGEG
jgi:cytidine deaminase